VICLSSGVPDLLRAETAAALGVADARLVLRFSDEFLWNALIGAFTACHVTGVAALASADCREFAWIRWAAGASFSIYVTHYPALHLLDALLPDTARYDIVLFSGALIVGLAFAAVFERPIARIRSGLRRVAGVHSLGAAPQSRSP
jgi:peptidoglycan/LPS O-acetylase OafA/YrhL